MSDVGPALLRRRRPCEPFASTALPLTTRQLVTGLGYVESMTPNEVGSRAEGMLLATLLGAGYAVLLPFGTSRYDLVIDGPG